MPFLSQPHPACKIRIPCWTWADNIFRYEFVATAPASHVAFNTRDRKACPGRSRRPRSRAFTAQCIEVTKIHPAMLTKLDPCFSSTRQDMTPTKQLPNVPAHQLRRASPNGEAAAERVGMPSGDQTYGFRGNASQWQLRGPGRLATETLEKTRDRKGRAASRTVTSPLVFHRRGWPESLGNQRPPA